MYIAPADASRTAPVTLSSVHRERLLLTVADASAVPGAAAPAACSHQCAPPASVLAVCVTGVRGGGRAACAWVRGVLLLVCVPCPWCGACCPCGILLARPRLRLRLADGGKAGPRLKRSGTSVVGRWLRGVAARGWGLGRAVRGWAAAVGGGGEICAAAGCGRGQGSATVGGRRTRQDNLGLATVRRSDTQQKKTAAVAPIPHTNTCEIHTRIHKEMDHALVQLSS